MKRTVTALLSLGLVSLISLAVDGPQWRGRDRDGVYDGVVLLKQWPEDGPKQLWTSPVDLGEGYSSVSVAGDVIYATGMVGGEGYLFALDLDGKLKWKRKYGPEWEKDYPGSRSTPTVHDGLVYVISGRGIAACFSVSGEPKWSVELLERFQGRNIRWGMAESPLVFDDKMICSPGGPDAAVAALNRKTGDTIWTTKGLSDKSAYCSPILVPAGKRKLIATMTESHLVGIDASDGTVLWKRPYRNQWAAHPNSPVHHDGQVYFTSGYGLGGVMLRLSEDGARATEAWTNKTPDTHHGGVVLVDGHIYGSQSRGRWACVSWKDGRTKWVSRKREKGSIIAADGMLITYDENTRRGTVALAKATPDGYQRVSEFRITKGDGPHWAHPVIADGRLYIRHGKFLMAFEVGKAKDG